MSSTSQLSTWYARPPRATRTRLAAVLATFVLVLGLAAGLTTTAAAQEEQEEPEPTQLEFQKQGWYTNSPGAAIPDSVVEAFPPQVVCLVVPPACGPQTEPVVDPVREAKTEHDIDEDNVPRSPAQPFVAPGTLPTGRIGGKPHYASSLQFAVPEVPEGKEIASFVLRVPQAQPTYRTSSPLFRQVVLAVLKGYQDGDPYSVETLVAELMVALNDPETYPPAQTSPMRVEACPAQSKWEAGSNQTWDKRPEVGYCLLGNEGTRKELDDGSVVYDFDLTMAVKDIAAGEAPNQGFFLHAFAAENMSYGDNEPTDVAQLSMSAPGSDNPPVALITYQAATGSDTFTLGSPGGSSGGSTSTGGSTFSGTESGSTGSTTGTSTSTSTGGGEAFTSAPSFETQSEPQRSEPAPAVAAPKGGSEGSGSGGQQQSMGAPAGATAPITPWYVWTLIPFGLAGMYLMSRALTAAPAVAVERKGAMSRLIEQRRQQQTSGLGAQFQV